MLSKLWIRLNFSHVIVSILRMIIILNTTKRLTLSILNFNFISFILCIEFISHFRIKRSFNFIKNPSLASLKFSNFDRPDIICQWSLNRMRASFFVPFCIISPVNVFIPNNGVMIMVVVECRTHISQFLYKFNLYAILILNIFLHRRFSFCLEIYLRFYFI